MRFRHLDYPTDVEVTELGPAAIDDLLDRGDLEDWKPLLGAVRRDPWGPLAETVLRLCDEHRMYGTSALWRAWIEHRRGEEATAPGAITLAEARSRAGMTQSEVAERMGISQSDVSKLERRGDVLVSTLRRYADAIGMRLRLRLEGPEDGSASSVRLGGEARS